LAAAASIAVLENMEKAATFATEGSRVLTTLLSLPSTTPISPTGSLVGTTTPAPVLHKVYPTLKRASPKQGLL